MYHDPIGKEGRYIDNIVKYHCFGCARQFFVGEELLKRSGQERLHCPYCQNDAVDWEAKTDEESLDLLLEMGCVGLYFNVNE